MTLKNEPPGYKVSNMLQGKSRGKLVIALETIKWLEQSGNNTRLWMSGGESKIRCCKEQHYIETWNVRSMNQGKLDV